MLELNRNCPGYSVDVVNDIVAVALISAGSSLLGASVGALTTYKVSLRNSETTIETAKAQHEVELARIEAENERLREQHNEEERRNRQSTYHQLIDSLFELFQIMGYAASDQEVEKACNRYRYLHAGVVLFAPASVRKGAFEVSEIYARYGQGSLKNAKKTRRSLSRSVGETPP